MLMWLDIIGNAMIGGGTGFVVSHFLGKRKRKPSVIKPEHIGTLPWTICKSSKNAPNIHGFQCTKCLSLMKNLKQPPLCSCEEYHLEHFHFHCGDCGFKSILRTADDA